LLSVAGGMLIAATTAIVMYLRTSRETKNTLRRQAMELARSNADLQQFAYAAAHDLQEPLRAITIHTQMLQARHPDKLDGEAQTAIDHAVEAAKVIRAKIADIQVYLRLAERIGPLAPVDTDLILAGVLQGLKLEIAERNASVTSTPLPKVMADGAQLTQVFGHLIGNALKYQPPDQPPEVTISAEERNGEWVFSVTDNGLGIAPDYHDRIFGVFRRLHTQEQYPGTGMGLAICKKIVECHGGHMGVRSEAGKGSTFFFSLPIRRHGDGEPPRPSGVFD
jgi:light-regulated signal transduction histidine kinase (bacteriophytochrome)